MYSLAELFVFSAVMSIVAVMLLRPAALWLAAKLVVKKKKAYGKKCYKTGYKAGHVDGYHEGVWGLVNQLKSQGIEVEVVGACECPKCTAERAKTKGGGS